jgi:hypothetical protein
MIIALSASSCGGGASGQGTGGSGSLADSLEHPGDVGKGNRIIYVLQDASCDMRSKQDVANRTRALEIAADAAAFDSGTVARGVVRQLASQNVMFDTITFKPEGSSSMLRVNSALDQLDAAFKSLRPLAGSAGGQSCRSDLLGALSEVAREHRALVQRIGHDVPKEIVYVTNGLIVDPARKLVLTRQPIEKPAVYSKTLKEIKSTWRAPNLSGFVIWLVGVGHNSSIKTERGPAVIDLWRALLKPTGAVVKEPVVSAGELPPTLSNPSH